MRVRSVHVSGQQSVNKKLPRPKLREHKIARDQNSVNKKRPRPKLREQKLVHGHESVFIVQVSVFWQAALLQEHHLFTANVR